MAPVRSAPVKSTAVMSVPVKLQPERSVPTNEERSSKTVPTKEEFLRLEFSIAAPRRLAPSKSAAIPLMPSQVQFSRFASALYQRAG